MICVLALMIGYLIGSVNPAIIISKLMGTDIRKHGSGNAGATNTYRTLGAVPAFGVLFFDILKGVIAVLLARLLFPNTFGADICAGFGAILGHNFPLYFKFKGGKGVLTSFAVALVLQPWSALMALAIGIAVIAATKYVSLGSMVGAVVLPIATVFFSRGNIMLLAFMTLLALLVIIRHNQNIERLMAGKERKFGEKKRKEDEKID